MIEVQERRLRAFKEHVLSSIERVVEEVHRVRNVRNKASAQYGESIHYVVYVNRLATSRLQND
jgi:hypothetical protein